MNRLHELQNLIDQADHAYYTTGNALYEDAYYDQLKEELKTLNPTDPRLTRVGATLKTTILTKRSHAIRMDSQDKVTCREEFDKWVENNIGDFQAILHASYKMDGGSGSFEYKQGRLAYAVTRGDGKIGEDITGNAVKFQNLPAQVKTPKGTAFNGFVRGEMILPVEDWEAIDETQESNPRNKCTGIARRKDGEESELLQVYAFRGFDANGEPLGKTETEQETILRNMGFKTAPSKTGNADEIWEWYLATHKQRPSLDYWIDGIVVKLDDIEAQMALGETEHHPRGQIAIKFPAEEATTTLIKATLVVGHTGAIVPVGTLKPVKLGGSTISNVTLCNWDNIKRLQVAVDDEVAIIKAGDIIPRLTHKIKNGENRKEITEPTACPACGGTVGRRKNLDDEHGSILYCLNPECTGRRTERIKRFINSLNILGLGDTMVEAMVTNLDVKDAADLFTLHNKREAIATLKTNGKTRIGEKRTDKILAAIEKRRKLTVPEFLGSIGIPTLGKRRVTLIQKAVPEKFDQLEDWFGIPNGNPIPETKSEQPSNLKMLERISCQSRLITYAQDAKIPNMASGLQKELNQNLGLINKFLANGVEITTANPQSQLSGAFTICITGQLSQPKEHFKELVLAAGHTYADSFTKAVTHLVAADPNSGSTKLQKAARAGTNILSEEQLLELLEKNQLKTEPSTETPLNPPAPLSPKTGQSELF